MKKIIVTGGSGFIGTNLIDELLKKKNRIINIDIKSPKKIEHKALWVEIDIRNYSELEETVLEFSPDFVIHLAARTDLNGKDIAQYTANTVGVDNLINILKKLKSIERVIFASSMYVCYPGYKPIDYDDYCPHTIYGESKVETERIIKNNNPEYTWSIIRPTSIWGPWFGEPYNHFFKIVLSRMYLHLGKRACRKTYGYIDNAIYQIFSILESNAAKVDEKVFYIGDYEPYDIGHWADEIAFEKGFKIPKVPFAVFKMLAVIGDLLKKINIKFPMTSFRLKNMTTDNMQDLSMICKIAPKLPVKRVEGVVETIKWIDENEK